MNFKPYPFVRYLCLLVSGILLYEYLKPSWFWPLVLMAAAFLSFLTAFLLKKPAFLKTGLFSGVLLLGCCVARLNNERLLGGHFLNAGKFSEYLACVDSPTETKPKTYKCVAEVKAVKVNGRWKSSSGKTLVYITKEANASPSFGDVFLIRGQPRDIEPPDNTFEFDYRRYQERKNIFTQHFLKEDDFTYAGHKTFHPLFAWANQLTRYSDVYFKKYLGSSREVGVAEALVAGMRSELDYEIINAYSVSGAIHVLSVSGMHVGILFLVLTWLMEVVRPQSSKKLFPTFVLILLLWMYALYTGLSPSACRATLMFSVIQLGNTLKRQNNNYNGIAFSAFVLLLVNPSWLFDVGFQLSYLAVLGIVMLYSPIRNILEIKNRALRWLWEISVVSFVAQLFTFPLSIYYFHQFPTYFLFSNPVVAILATPLLPLGVLFVILAPLPYAGASLGWLLKFLLKLLNDFIVFTTTLPYASLRGFNPGIPELLLLYLLTGAVVWFFLQSEIRALKLAALSVMLLCMIKVVRVYRQNQQQELTFHYIPNRPGLSIIEARHAEFIAPDSVLKDPMVYQFHLKNYYDYTGINRVNKRPGGGGRVSGKGFELLWLADGIPPNHLLDVQFLLISHNSVKDLAPFRSFKGRIILDGSNKKWVCDKLKAQAEGFQLNLVSLYDEGSLTCKLERRDLHNR